MDIKNDIGTKVRDLELTVLDKDLIFKKKTNVQRLKTLGGITKYISIK